MNFGVFLLAILSAASIEAISDDFLENRNKCIDILELDEEMYPKAKDDSTSSELDAFMIFYPNDYESLALWKCVLKKEKVISAKGEYQMDAFRKWLSDEIDVSEIEECMNIKDEDPCDASHLINKCVVEHLYMESEETAEKQ